MHKQIVSIFLTLVVFCIPAIAQTNIQPATPHNISRAPVIKHQIVIQLSSSDTAAWKGLMNNLKHLKDKWGNSVQIEVVAHGPGIEMLMNAKTTQQIKIIELKNSGVVFAACMNTMKARNLTKDAILSEAIFVPSGVVEIVMKQEEGWHYLKTGF
jgi:intracellular sulfur oxidation DsrE/DsrF family protein